MRSRVAVSTLLNGIGSLAPQLFALVLLPAFSFGLFSVSYLMFAFASSLALSILCEPWAITYRGSPSAGEWRFFSSIAVEFAGSTGVMASVITYLIVGDGRQAALSGICTVLAVYRVNARFFHAFMGNWRSVVFGDLLLLIGAGVGFGTGGAVDLDALTKVFLIWASSNFSSLIAFRRPNFVRFSLVRWWRRHAAKIRPLLTESLLMDASSIGTPYLLLPIMGLQNFGVYRAVSNLSAPARMLLTPLRPLISAKYPKALVRMQGLLPVVAAAIVAGTIVAAMLLWIGDSEADLGVVSALSEYAFATGVYTSSVVLLQLYYFISRTWSEASRLFSTRLVQTVVGIMAPIGGYLAMGLAGAIWGYALSTGFSCLLWMRLARTG